jgi:hypothetical protein
VRIEKLEWKYEGEEDSGGVVTAYTAHPFAVEALSIFVDLLEDVDGNRGVGLKLTAYCEEVLLAQQTVWNIGIFGPPDFDTNGETLLPLANGMLGPLVTEAHKNVHFMLTATEARAKRLTEVMAQMEVVTLERADRTLRVNTRMAHQVLLMRNVEVQMPFRMERIKPDVAVCYNENGFVVGHIGYNPLREDPAQSRFGLFAIDESEV